MGRIAITGDTHGDLDIVKIYEFYKSAVEDGYKFTKDDYMVICGDWGAVWGDDEYDTKMINFWKGFPFTTIVCLGNHENYPHIYNSFTKVFWHGGYCRVVAPNVFIVERGQILTLNDKKFFFMGGADSSDKWCRVEGISWWSEEMPTDYEYDIAMGNLRLNNYKVDYIITHCAPDSVQDQLSRGTYEHNKLTNFLEIVKKETEFKDWFFGHYHINHTYEGNYHCLYNNVKEII